MPNVVKKILPVKSGHLKNKKFKGEDLLCGNFGQPSFWGYGFFLVQV